MQALDRMGRVIPLDVAQVRRPVVTAQKEHKRGLRCLESGDAEKAGKTMDLHILNAKGSIFRAL